MFSHLLSRMGRVPLQPPSDVGWATSSTSQGASNLFLWLHLRHIKATDGVSLTPSLSMLDKVSERGRDCRLRAVF